ncbi:hypothetical protein Tsubulata_034320 [Turnera subulata]|uniref:4-coumarate--CoA ligase n=1 Tax=Turnera subulata TaxID=218843 RepID=A0A9Q0FPR0_9ROSI|nr:hypothetical protein Tsubulata_034320 [Turnera subulata]
MAKINHSSSINPKSGFNSITRIFHSLAPPIHHLPPNDLPLTAAEYALELSSSSTSPDSVAFIDSATGHRLTYLDFTNYIRSLAFYLQNVIKLSKNDTAFILSPNSIKVPILYFSLLSLGVTISPTNPLSTESEISHQLGLCKPVIAFATSSAAGKLPKMKHKTILLDSPEFDSMMTTTTTHHSSEVHDGVKVDQNDVAGILYSSGTTGKTKGVMLTHRNLISAAARYYSMDEKRRESSSSQAVMLYTVPYFHVFGFSVVLKSVVSGDAVVVMERFGLEKMLRAVEEFRVTDVVVAPPVLAAMTKSDLAGRYDLKSLENVGSGGAPVARNVITAFLAKFPSVQLSEGYGLTEAGAVAGSEGLPGGIRPGSVGKLWPGCEAKIVDPDTGDAMPPGKQGELWVRSPTLMKGYIGDAEATSATLRPDGWLKTGDLCYIDDEGYLFVVDRLKELIKYKGYQVPPAELEQVLLSHQEIIDAAVIPYPDEEAGQVPMALVVKHPTSNISERDIMEFAAKQVAPYKKIRHVAFVSTIPKNPAGKILRRNLRKMIAERPPSKL